MTTGRDENIAALTDFIGTRAFNNLSRIIEFVKRWAFMGLLPGLELVHFLRVYGFLSIF